MSAAAKIMSSTKVSGEPVPADSRRGSEWVGALQELHPTEQGVYPHGVGRVGATDSHYGHASRYDPSSTNRLYLLNEHLDRDKDGIACEKA
jgi:hypothetical protein